MRIVRLFTDDFGNLCRYVETESCKFWYPAVGKKEHALFMSWEIYDDWGGLK